MVWSVNRGAHGGTDWPWFVFWVTFLKKKKKKKVFSQDVQPQWDTLMLHVTAVTHVSSERWNNWVYIYSFTVQFLGPLHEYFYVLLLHTTSLHFRRKHTCYSKTIRLFHNYGYLLCLFTDNNIMISSKNIVHFQKLKQWPLTCFTCNFSDVFFFWWPFRGVATNRLGTTRKLKLAGPGVRLTAQWFMCINAWESIIQNCHIIYKSHGPLYSV